MRSAGARWARSIETLEFVGVVMQSRHRAEQAQTTSHAVIAKIGSSEDPDLRSCAAAAEFIIGQSLIVLGHPLAGIRAIDAFTRRGDMDAIQAWQWLNQRPRQDASVVSELGGISSAALRAHMLGGGDPAITKIAYEDSIADRQANSAHPALSRLAARFLRPKVDKTPPDNTHSPRDPRLS